MVPAQIMMSRADHDDSSEDIHHRNQQQSAQCLPAVTTISMHVRTQS